jgi:hypothetical protein
MPNDPMLANKPTSEPFPYVTSIDLLSLYLIPFLVGLRTYQHPCILPVLSLYFFWRYNGFFSSTLSTGRVGRSYHQVGPSIVGTNNLKRDTVVFRIEGVEASYILISLLQPQTSAYPHCVHYFWSYIHCTLC